MRETDEPMRCELRANQSGQSLIKKLLQFIFRLAKRPLAEQIFFIDFMIPFLVHCDNIIFHKKKKIVKIQNGQKI
jgi:hypothetical protein